MKYLDRVKVLKDTTYYNDNMVFKNAEGTIISAEIRQNSFDVVFSKSTGEDYAHVPILVKDLKLINDNKITDEEILEALPKNDPNWWCKVENGFILNLKGEKKNKIPYDYES